MLEVDARRIGEEHQHEGEFGETVQEAAAGIEPPELPEYDTEPEEDHRGRDDSTLHSPGDGTEGDEGHRERRENSWFHRQL